MSQSYDGRRPRIPLDLAAAIDAHRGQVPFNRFIVESLANDVGYALPKPVQKPPPPPPPPPKPAAEKPKPKPRPKRAKSKAPSKPKAPPSAPSAGKIAKAIKEAPQVGLTVDEALANVHAAHRAARGLTSRNAKAGVKPIPKKA